MQIPKFKRIVDGRVLKEVQQERCCICSAFPVDASHIRSRGAGGPDAKFNVVPHCRIHHTEWHQLGPSKFIKRYPAFGLKLQLLGWSFENGKLTHPDLNS